jgi:diadenosine tetraphosphate (Ap4A) HIT family hydrolase
MSVVKPSTDEELKQRDLVEQRVKALQEMGICPTCQNLEDYSVYGPFTGRLYYEDKYVLLFLDDYPRNPGHSILLTKHHYEDLSEMPLELGTHILKVTQAAIQALKEVADAEKVYFITMCDGKRNHLHFQLLPRVNTESLRGFDVFLKRRGVLVRDDTFLSNLNKAVTKALSE